MDWKKVEQVTKPPAVRPSDVFTAAEYAARFGMNISTARTRLGELASKGKLEAVSFLENSRHTVGYRVREND